MLVTMSIATDLPDLPIAFEPPGVLDIEASGFGVGSYPIEVGFVLPDGQSYCTLIRPAPNWLHWDPQAQKVHGISQQMLATHGRSVQEVAQELNDRLQGRTLYTDAWLHDYTWLATLYEAAEQVPAFRLDDLRSLFTETEATHWHVVKKQVATELKLQRHRASSDARILQSTLIRLRAPLPRRA